MIDQKRPMLEGIRIIDLSTVVFGPYCTQILSDLGAEVIKIESPPTGDNFRYSGKTANTTGMSPGHHSVNRGKKSAILNLKDEEDRRVLNRLISSADVFIHNIRMKAIEKLGFSYEDVRAIKPDIVYLHCVGFGSDGPYAGLQAYDDIIQAATGAATLSSRVDGDQKPRYLPSLVADKVAGLHGAYAVLAAIVHRLRTGEGQFVETPMFESFTHFMMKEHLAGLTFDPPVGKVCYDRQVDPDRQPFPTADGYICIVPYTLDAWDVVFELLGDPEFMTNDVFSTPVGRLKNQGLCYRRMAELTPAKTSAEWTEIFRGASIPAIPVRDVSEILDDPHLRSVEFFQKVHHPTEGDLYSMKEPSKFSAWAPSDTPVAPLLGEHTEEITILSQKES